MANLVFASHNKAMPKLDGSLKRKVYDFFEKLIANDSSPGLHVEPLRGAADPRVRTARVDLHYRAMLFEVSSKEAGTTYVYMGTWAHDEATKLAERSTLRVNPVNGVLEGIIEELAEPVTPPNQVQYTVPAAQTHAQPPLSAFSLAELTGQLGLDQAIAERALAAPDDYALTAIAERAPGWQGSVLIDLATGDHLEEIRERYGFNSAPVDPELGESEKILRALEHPASKMQFAYIEDNAELRRVIDSGDFGAWRTFLHPDQRDYVTRHRNGACRLAGGAGTGKTVVAIHRARFLASADSAARVVLTTYNTTLARGMAADLTALDPSIPAPRQPGVPGVHVCGIDALAKSVLDHADSLTAAYTGVFGKDNLEFGGQRTQSDTVWREVLQTNGARLEPRLANATFLEQEYVGVILKNRVTTLEQYARVPRTGRGVRLSRPQRIAIWDIVSAYRRHSQMDGTLSFPEVAAVAAEQLRLQAEAGLPYLADHVIVDEAQDLHASHWRLLRALAATGPNDIFIAEDAHQRIYGQPITLKHFGISVGGRSRRLTLNYRTTAQNLNFAVNILAGENYMSLLDEPDSTSKYRSARTGPTPQLVKCASETAELDHAAGRIRAWIDAGTQPETIAVLTRSHDSRDRFVRGLGERGVDARILDKSPVSGRHPQILTMHRAKGMEFSRVILANVDDKHIPSLSSLRAAPQEEQADVMLRERSLLYVAASRARDELVVTWTGDRSELLGANA